MVSWAQRGRRRPLPVNTARSLSSGLPNGSGLRPARWQAQAAGLFQFDLQGLMAHDAIASLAALKGKTILAASSDKKGTLHKAYFAGRL
jgi:hypothetical protein